MINMSFRPKAFRPEWRNLLIIITLLALTGCKYPFDLETADVKPIPVIKSYICADSLVTIDIRKAVPLSQIAKADSSLKGPRYTLRCNGVQVDCAQSMKGGGRMVLSAGAFRNGDKIELVFESDDMETAVAGTVIPGAFPEHELKLCRSNNTDRNLKISYKDDPDTDDWYGAIVKWNGTQVQNVGLEEPQYNEVKDMHIIPPSGYDDLQIEPGAYSPIIVSFGGTYMYVWKDSDEEDNEYDLCYNYRAQWDGRIEEVKDVEIQCTLFRLSSEMYRHLFAEYDRQNNPFKDMGLSSPAFTYTNVKNGTGCLCGYSAVRSQWIEDTLFEQQ